MHRFLAWAQRADAEDRADAASALARAYLYSDLTPSLRGDAVVAMTALLDDPSAMVRRALAEALASASGAPRHLALALANDQSEVAAAVLARSPILTDAELVDCAAVGDVVAQCAIARRPNLGAGPSEALAEIGERDAAIALIGNPEADLSAGALCRFFDRFADDAEAREALHQRPSLPVSLKADIAMATAKALSDCAAECLGPGRAERIAREARERAIASIAATCRSEERAELARSLRERGALTMALLLRSLLSGERELFAAALAELAGMSHRRVAAFLRDPRGEGFAALALRAGLPSHALTVFRAALSALETHRGARGEGLRLPLVEKVIASCEERDDPALAKILSLLWRFAAEAARAESRGFARQATVAARAPRPPPSLDYSPAVSVEGGDSPLLTVVYVSPGASAGTPDLGAASDKPDGGAPAHIELPVDLIAALEEAANDEGGETRAPAEVFDTPGASAEAPELIVALDEPDGDAAPRIELPIDFMAALEQAIDDEGGEAPPLSLVFDLSGAAAEAPDLGVALDGSGDGAAPPVEPPTDPIATFERAA